MTRFRVLGRVLIISFLAGCCVVGISILTVPPRVPHKMAISKNLVNARQLAAACRLYALEHQDRFPSHLDELEPKYVPHGELEELRRFYAGQRPGNQMDWLYFGAGFEVKSPPQLLLASPQAMSIRGTQWRVVFSRNTTGSLVAEDEYERLLSETVQQIKALGQDHAAPTSSSTP
ncbi:MAG TPA: hypothetical protein VGM54_12270 [Chthoniobacter sp.]